MTREELAQKTRADLLKMPEAKTLKGKTSMTKIELVEAIWGQMDGALRKKTSQINRKTLEKMTTHASSPLTWGNKYAVEESHSASIQSDWSEPTIPDKYNQTKLVIMARDPYWIFAYWEISEHDRQELNKHHGPWYERPFIMRVYDVTDIYFNGYNAHRFFDVQLSHQAGNWYIYVGEADRSFCCELGFLDKNGIFVPIIRSNTVNTPRDRISHIVDEEWMVVEEDFQKLFRLAGGMRIGQSSLELMEKFKKRLESEISSGVVSSISSPARFMEKERKFWLVVHTELILYGATEPGASVTVQGKPIQLKEDGTFSIRFALPDGQQYIPVTSVSPDQIDKITITPVVTKTTT